MKKGYSKIRLIAFFTVFIFTFSLVFSGCSLGNKVESRSDLNKTNSDIINIQTDPYATLPEGSQIIVGPDGQSYLVDGEGNSQIYNPVLPTVTTATTTTTTTTTTNKNNPQTEPSSATTTTTTTTTQSVFNALAIQRKFGFNKAYDDYAGLANFYLDTIRVYFTYDNKDWLIEFWKGEYAMASVGCEIGFYYNDNPSSSTNAPLSSSIGEQKHFKAVDDADTMVCTMELWQYKKSSDSEPTKMLSFGPKRCWWASAFENGVLEKHSDRTSLVMRGSIEFPTTEMMELFCNALEERGFKEGSTSTYKNVEVFSVNGKTVTVNWRYYDEDRFQANN